jgi:glycosyltransferase involved in cell wall biosynthesis
VVKISIVATHPIQYHIPWFIELSNRPDLQVKVYFCYQPDDQQQGAGFDQPFKWDLPMYDGYEWQVLVNKNRGSGITSFFSTSVRNMVDVFRRDRPDVMVLTGWQALPLLQALWACIRLRIPRLVRGESSGLKPRGLLLRLAHRLLLSQFDAFLVIGKANHMFYSSYGIPDSKLFSCPYFVENKRLLKQAKDHRVERHMLRTRWQIPQCSVCYLYVGKLNHKKRVLDQLAALKIALSVNSNLHLLIVGTGELMERAKQFTEEHKLPVTFAGFLNQTEITAAYVAADCLIISSDYDETWGLAANEAMVCGLPAIVSGRAGCGMDLVRRGETGEIFPFGEIDALSGLMASMARDPGRLTKMGERARDLVLRDYSPETTVEGTVKAAEVVLGQGQVLDAK